MAQSYSITAILSAVDRGFSSAMDKAAKSTESLGKTVQDKMGGIGKAMTYAGAATTAMGVSALKGYGDFEYSLNQAAVIAGGTAKDIDGLAKVANKMGAELPISAQDAANAMVAMARDGASIETIKQRFPAIAKAATAAGADLETTASVVQQSMNIWGKSLKSPEQAAGILVQVANQSNASIESMQQALSSIGPTAASAGYSMQDTANAIGLLTNTGMSSAQAADNLNHAIVQMQSPTKKSRGYMEELGISFRDAEGNMKPIPQVASELSGALKNLGKEQQDAALKAMFGQDGMKVMRTLMKAVADETDNTTTSWNAAAKAIEEYAGSTKTANKNLDKQAKEMQQNVGSSLEQLGGNWDNLMKTSMAGAKKINGALIGSGNDFLQWATTSNESTAKAIRSFIGLSPAIGTAMTAVGGFLTNAQKIGGALSGGIRAIKLFGSGVGSFVNVSRALIGIAKGSQSALLALQMLAKTSIIAKTALLAYNVVVKIATAVQAAFNAVMALNPFVLIIAAIAAVITALVLFFTKTKMGQQIWASFVSWLSDAWNKLKELASVVWEAIVQAFSSAVDKVKSAWNGIVEFFSNLWQGIVDFAVPIWNSFLEAIAPIIDAFKNLWDALKEFFVTLWQAIVDLAVNIWNGLVEFMTPIIEAIKTAWNTMTEFFSNLWQGIVEIATTVWQSIVAFMTPIIETIKMLWNGFSEFMSGLWQSVVNVATNVWNTLVSVVTSVWESIKSYVQMAITSLGETIQTGITTIQTTWSNIWNTIVLIAQTVWNNIVTIISAVLNALAEIIQAATEAIKGNWQGALEHLRNAADTIWDAIKSVIESTLSVIRSIIEGILNTIEAIVTAVWEAIKSVTSSIWDGIKSVISNTIDTIKSTISNTMENIKSAFSRGWETAKQVTSDGIEGALDAVKRVASDMVSAGKDFVMGFVRGIKGAIGKAVSAAVDMAKSAFDSAKRALGINSPSRVMRDKVGRFVPAGLAVGMIDNLSIVEKASDKLAEASMFAVPAVDTTDFTRSLTAVNGKLTGSVDSNLTHELSLNQQPAYINVSLGGTDYGAFVADISREQGSQASLTRNYKF